MDARTRTRARAPPACAAVLPRSAAPHACSDAAATAGVRVGPSSIPNAGQGVFASRELPKGVVLGAYAGERLTLAEMDARYPRGDARYVLDVRGVYLDAADPAHSNWTRYINSPHGTRLRANVAFRGSGSVVTARRIRSGEELLVSYGRCYLWAS